MRLTRSIFILIVMSVFFVLPSYAAKKEAPKKRVVYQKETVIRFDDSVIEGKIIKPDGFFLLRQRPKRWQDLIKIRENYEPELAEMKYEL